MQASAQPRCNGEVASEIAQKSITLVRDQRSQVPLKAVPCDRLSVMLCGVEVVEK